MAKKFKFEYLGKAYNASAQAYHEHGILKYRVAFESNLIVFHELISSIGSPTGPVFVQEVDSDEAALPDELLQEIGFGLEEIDFFPGSFWVDYTDGGNGYFAQFVKDYNTYKMVYCYLPDLESIKLPVVITKEIKENNNFWKHDASYPKPAWFDKVVKAIGEYEKRKD